MLGLFAHSIEDERTGSENRTPKGLRGNLENVRDVFRGFSGGYSNLGCSHIGLPPVQPDLVRELGDAPYVSLFSLSLL